VTDRVFSFRTKNVAENFPEACLVFEAPNKIGAHADAASFPGYYFSRRSCAVASQVFDVTRVRIRPASFRRERTRLFYRSRTAVSKSPNQSIQPTPGMRSFSILKSPARRG
jgi:hypothetical protein